MFRKSLTLNDTIFKGEDNRPTIVRERCILHYPHLDTYAVSYDNIKVYSPLRILRTDFLVTFKLIQSIVRQSNMTTIFYQRYLSLRTSAPMRCCVEADRW